MDSATDFLTQLASTHFPGTPVMVSGSYARNAQTSDSDIDLLVFTDEVHTPLISCREIEGHKVELIRLPKHQTLYYLERTSHNSGAYITMVHTGRIIQDDAGFLESLQKWASGVYLSGPPKDGKHRKIYRHLIDMTNMLEDMEGDKPAVEKLFTANQLLLTLNTTLFLLHDLWPMKGKWATRTLDALYPGYTKGLFMALDKAIREEDFMPLVQLAGRYMEEAGGRQKSYDTAMKGELPPDEKETVQVMAAGEYFRTAEAANLREVFGLKRTYQDMYIKVMQDTRGALGIALPSAMAKDPTPFRHMEKVFPDRTISYAYEPVLTYIYGGPAAFPLAERFFSLASEVALSLKLQVENAETYDGHMLSTCAYLVPIFTAQFGIHTERAVKFARYLSDCWITEAADPGHNLHPVQRQAEKVKLKGDLMQKARESDPDLLELSAAILQDPELRFDAPLFDRWADTLNAMGKELQALSGSHALSPDKSFALTTGRASVHPTWYILKAYLEYFFDLIDMNRKDRIYLLCLLQAAAGQPA